MKMLCITQARWNVELANISSGPRLLSFPSSLLSLVFLPRLPHYILVCSRHNIFNRKKANPVLDLPEETVRGWRDITFLLSSCLVAGVTKHRALSALHCGTVLRRLHSLVHQIQLERTHSPQSCCESLIHSIHAHLFPMSKWAHIIS